MTNKYFDNPGNSDLETIFSRFQAGIGPKALGRGEMISIIVQNPLTNADGSANTSELFFGSASNMIYFMIPGQESPLVYAEDLKDLYIKLNFPVNNPNGGILTVAILGISTGVGYTAGDVLTLASTFVWGTDATVTVLTVGGPLASAVLNAGGAGYVAGDVLHVTGGNSAGRITVDTVDGGGAVLTFHVSTPGNLYVDTVGNATTGGAGAGATFNTTTTHAVLTISLTTPGTGFIVGHVYTATGGTGAEAKIVPLTIETVIAETADISLLINRRRLGGRQ